MIRDVQDDFVRFENLDLEIEKASLAVDHGRVAMIFLKSPDGARQIFLDEGVLFIRKMEGVSDYDAHIREHLGYHILIEHAPGSRLQGVAFQGRRYAAGPKLIFAFERSRMIFHAQNDNFGFVEIL